MEINVIPLGDIQANCYLISTDKAAVVIDPGFDSPTVTNFLKTSANKERLILLTHSHFDHIGGALGLRNETNTKIAIGKLDNYALSNTQFNLANMFNAALTPFSADILFDNDDKILVGDITFKVIYTPGHTVGGVCYLTDNILFSGDTLFCRSIGRTDFYGGSYDTIKASIKNLYNSLPDDTIVLSGHGENTTIKQEKLENPYIRG
ncbi:MAG: MBL fold metallo-hydrolase [Clostridia bacterium]|nr:MBL fold metallo-hydrolase [Clostridia bacterium]